MVSAPGADLLAYAEAILDGKVKIPAVRVTRAAAILARQAVESIIEAESKYIEPQLVRASTRSKLVVLQQLGDPERAVLLTRAWNGLSQACHHHAYELHPTDSEVRHLLMLVTQLIETTAN